jgi:hypothetical protein
VNLQSCNEEIPVLNFTEIDQEEVEVLIYSISQVCEEIASVTPVVIKIIKPE